MKKLSRNQSRHHRRSKYEQGSNNPENISIVTKNRHRAFHLLFRHGNPQYIAEQLNKIWLDPAYEVVIRKKQPTLDW